MRRTTWFGNAVAIAVLLLVAAACTKPPLTDVLRERYSLGAEDLKRVQLYTSSEIVLRRETTGQEKSLAGSEMRIRDGVAFEEVVIRKKTPCVALRIEGKFVLVGFSPEHPDYSLWFTLNTKTDPPPEGRRYELVALANPPTTPVPFVPDYAKGFLVTYGGKKYHVDAESWGAHLLVDLEESFANNRIRHEAPGWRLDEKPRSSVSIEPSAPQQDAGAPP